MQRNPCNNCNNAMVYNGRYYKRHFNDVCNKCMMRKRHEDYLNSKRKYKKGRQVLDINDFLNQEWLYFNDRVVHIEVCKSWQFRTLENSIKNKKLFIAIRKDNMNE